MLVLKNESLHLEVNPTQGGRIENLIDRTNGRNWVWHPHRSKNPAPDQRKFGASFDELWDGGWDDIFPNDAPAHFAGKYLADHGELWSRPWQVSSQNEHEINLECQCQSLPIEVHKTIGLAPKKREFALIYQFHNTSSEEVPFFFKFHPALRIESGDQIIMPNCQLRPVDLGFSTLAQTDDTSPFPYVKDKDGKMLAIDCLGEVDGKTREFVYASQLSEGYSGLRHNRSRTELIFTFDRLQFPYVWLFQSLGGFFDHHVLMLEPCTNDHYDFNTNLAQGKSPSLRPHEKAFYKLEVSLRSF